MRRVSITGVLTWTLFALPVLATVLGPLFAGSTRSVAAPLRAPDATYPLGTDVLGRDVLALSLSGGISVLLLSGLALLLAYVLGVPLALLIAGTSRRWLDETVLRVLDVMMALPSMLILLMLAATGRQSAGALVLSVAVLQVPPVVRLVRGAALAPGCRTAVESLTMQGERWWRVHLGYVGRAVLAPVVVDAGNRLSLVLYLMASANFLGLGLAPATSDWGVLIERNREALFIQPFAVMAPAILLIALCTGCNLIADRRLSRRKVAV